MAKASFFWHKFSNDFGSFGIRKGQMAPVHLMQSVLFSNSLFPFIGFFLLDCTREKEGRESQFSFVKAVFRCNGSGLLKRSRAVGKVQLPQPGRAL